MTYTIRTPNPEFNGTRAGLIFQAGTATTDDIAIAQYCKYVLGYEVHPDPDHPTPPKPSKPRPSLPNANA